MYISANSSISSTSAPLSSTAASTPGLAWGPDGPWPTAPAVYTGGSIFDGSGGPALIIVFVAVGLLVGAFAALLIVRRAPPAAVVGATLNGWYLENGGPPLPGEKPKIYTAHLDVDDDAAARGCAYKDVTPFSARFVPDAEHACSDSEDKVSHIHQPPPPAAPHTASLLGRIGRTIREYYVPTDPHHPTRPSRDPHGDEKAQEAVVGQLQVAVMIAMPARNASSLHHSRRSSTLSDSDATLHSQSRLEEIPEVCLGFAHIRASAPSS